MIETDEKRARQIGARLDDIGNNSMTRIDE
jgi:hypothetical protein